MPDFSCLAGCMKKYESGPLVKAISREVIAPWVRLTLSGSGSVLTVGNESYPSQNTAVITSFHYSKSDGAGIDVEITDEEGGAFDKFFSKIINDQAITPAEYVIECEWGWTSSSCNSNNEPIKSSDVHYFYIKQVEVKYEQTLKFVMHGGDLFNAYIDSSKSEKAYGTDEEPILLEEAIRQLLADLCPPVTEYEQLRKLPNGKVDTWKWKKPFKGPFKADQSNPITIIKRWVRGYCTENDKGVWPAWDDTSKKPKLILWEDFFPDPQSAIAAGESLKTYIVNGGECSPVISFTPQIQWPLAFIQTAGGSADSRVSAERLKQQDDDEVRGKNKCDNDQGAGIVTTNPSSPDHHIRNYHKRSGEEFRRNDKRNTRANITSMTTPAIKAQIVVQGDPSLTDPSELAGSTFSVIVINPYHLAKNSACPEWRHLAESACNQTLSHKSWYLHKIDHDIRQGTYTTTLDLFVPPDNIQVAEGSPASLNKE